MRAVVIRTFGAEDVLTVSQIDTPTPREQEVRVRVAGAAVNRTDLNLRAGLYGLPEPAAGAPGHTFGMDVAGVIDALGAGVTGLQVGDAVVGFSGPPATPAAQAEYVVLPMAAVTPAPAGVPLVQAATLPLNGLTAAQALDQAGLPHGATVVVTGAAGGLGVFLLQLAHLAGHRVVAWVKPDTDPEGLRRLGADEVITSADQAGLRGSADAVIDAATLGQPAVGAIRDGGAYVTFRGNTPVLGRGIRQVDISVHNDGKMLQQLVEAVESGDLRLAGVTQVPLEQVAAAQQAFAAGGLRDRLVLVP
jgi:NADPH2:quinone reductase